MHICDFTSWIQLSATLNIAFVAVEYVKSYAKVIYDQVFNISKILEFHFAPCLDILGDSETVNCLKPREVEGRSTSSLIEQVKRDREILSGQIEATKKGIMQETDALCNTMSTSSLSLFVFFYSLIGLFLSGLEGEYESLTHAIWEFLTVGSISYLFFGWILGEKCFKSKFVNFSSLWHPISYILFFTIASIVLAFVNTSWLSDIEGKAWGAILVISLLAMFLNFIIFVYNIWRKTKEITISIKNEAVPIKKKCDAWKVKLDQLLSLEELNNGLFAD